MNDQRKGFVQIRYVFEEVQLVRKNECEANLQAKLMDWRTRRQENVQMEIQTESSVMTTSLDNPQETKEIAKHIALQEGEVFVLVTKSSSNSNVKDGGENVRE